MLINSSQTLLFLSSAMTNPWSTPPPSLQKRALKLQQKRQKEELEREQQREKEFEREKQLTAKPAKRTWEAECGVCCLSYPWLSSAGHREDTDGTFCQGMFEILARVAVSLWLHFSSLKKPCIWYLPFQLLLNFNIILILNHLQTEKHFGYYKSLDTCSKWVQVFELLENRF